MNSPIGCAGATCRHDDGDARAYVYETRVGRGRCVRGREYGRHAQVRRRFQGRPAGTLWAKDAEVEAVTSITGGEIVTQTLVADPRNRCLAAGVRCRGRTGRDGGTVGPCGGVRSQADRALALSMGGGVMDGRSVT